MKKNRLILISITVVVLLIILPFVAKAIKGYVYGSTGSTSVVLNSASYKIKRTFGFFFAISDLRKQNDEVAQKISQLEVDRSRIAELEYENILLKKELGFAQANKDMRMTPSRIIGREPTSFLDYIIIDKGREDGIKEKAAVISNGALVGQVREVFDNSAKIVLITSKDSNILAMLQDSRAKGILKGGISGLVLEDIIQDIEIKHGEYVITSGLEGEIPQGILIGKIGQLKSSSSDLFKNISVEPIVDLSKIEIVFIINEK